MKHALNGRGISIVVPCILAAWILTAGQVMGREIYVGDFLSARFQTSSVFHYDGQTGDLVGTIATGLDGPTGLAFLPDGDLAVAESQQDRILRYDGTSGAYEGILCDSGLDNPRGIATGPGGNLWIASLQTNAIVAVDPATGSEVRRLTVPRPMGVAIGNGRIYATSQSMAVYEFEYDTGQGLSTLAENVGQSLEAILVAPDNSVIVNSSTALVRLDWQSGKVLASNTGFGGEGMAFGNDGMLYAGHGTHNIPVILARVDPITLDIIAPAVTNFTGGHGIAIKLVPEPATLTILTLGGLTLLRRRRRR